MKSDSYFGAPLTRRGKADPREGMKCAICSKVLEKHEWPSNPTDAGVCTEKACQQAAAGAWRR